MVVVVLVLVLLVVFVVVVLLVVVLVLVLAVVGRNTLLKLRLPARVKRSESFDPEYGRRLL